MLVELGRGDDALASYERAAHVADGARGDRGKA